MKKGFTLLEIVIVACIIVVLAAIALVGFFETIRTTRRSKARHALSVISEAEKIYFFEDGVYESVPSNDFTDLSTGSGMDVTSLSGDTDWTYSVVVGPPAVATATRDSGSCAGDVIDLDIEAGVYTGTGCYQ